MTATIASDSHARTQELGERLGRVLQAGDCVALVGELGAGKTAFVQGLARGLGVGGRVASPTFTIVNEHDGRVPLFHVDFYRLEHADELPTSASTITSRAAGSSSSSGPTASPPRCRPSD